MAPLEDDARQVNNILRNLRGEHFRHARNVQRQSVSASSLSHQPTLPFDLIYPTQAPETSHDWVPGPSPPKSWRTSSSPTEPERNATTDTPAWREHAFSLFFSADAARPRPIYPDPSRIPQLTVLCLQLLRATCPGADLADVVPFIPPHLRRALARHAAVHAPLSQTELDALCGEAHVDTELVVVGPHTALRASALRRPDRADEAWDAPQERDAPGVLRSLAVLSSPLSAVTLFAFPPTLTHLALINLPQPIPLLRLPSICPLVVFLDVSYNTWLRDLTPMGKAWAKLQRLEVLGARRCFVSLMFVNDLNNGRWEDVKLVQL